MARVFERKEGGDMSSAGRMVGGVCLVALVLWIPLKFFQPSAPVKLGVTFSPLYAASLNHGDWPGVYEAVIEDLRIRHLRIPIYWSEIEREPDVLDWSSIDWMMGEAERVGAEVTLAVGAKVPRWPECFIPEWAERLSVEERNVAQLAFVRAAVERYRSAPALVRWQVENESMLPFGLCPEPDLTLLAQEIDAVHALDSRPVMLTVSGELDTWWTSAGAADVLGYSIYRFVWGPTTGFVQYPIPPAFYRVRAWMASWFASEVIVSEMQAEPWFPGPVREAEWLSWYEAFRAEDLVDVVEYARDTGAPEAYLWGVEWWYALKVKGDPRLWDAARTVL